MTRLTELIKMKRTTQGMLFSLIIACTAAIPACKDDNPTGANGSPSDIVFPADSVSYSRHLQPLFNQACAMSGCHSAVESSDRVRLNNYQNLMFGQNGTPVVVAGRPESSLLVSRIDGQLGQRMPLNLNPLNQNQIDGIKKWITEGAKNN